VIRLPRLVLAAIAVSALLTASIPALADNAAEAQKHFNAAVQFDKAGKVDLAIREMQAAKKLMPKLPAIYLNLGMFYAQKRDLADSQAAFKQALAIDPKNKVALSQLTRILVGLDKNTEALNYARKLIALDPKDTEARFVFGVVNLKLRDFEVAEDSFKDVLHVNPDDKGALYNLSYCYIQAKQYRQALEYLEKFLKISPNDPQAHLMAGAAAEQIGDKRTAISHYDAACAGRSPILAPATMNLVRIYMASDKPDKAIEVLKRAAKLDKSNYEINLNLGKMLYGRDKAKEAEPYLIAARNAHPDVLSNALLAMVYVKQKLYNKASACASAGMQIDPKSKQALEVYAFVKGMQGRYDDVVLTMRKWEKYYPQDPEPNQRIAGVYLFEQKPDMAFKEYDLAVKKRPNNAEILTSYADALLGNHQPDKAVDLYNKAIALKPKDVKLRLNLASCLQSQNKFDDAITTLKKVIELDPKSEDAYTMLAMVYQSQQKNDLAIEQYKKILEFNPKSVSALQRLAYAYETQKNYQAELDTYRKLVEIDPKSSAAGAIPRIYDQMGKLDDAISEARKLVSAQPADTQMRGQLADFLVKKQDWAGAIEQYNEIAKGKDDAAKSYAYTQIGGIQEKQNKPDDAIESYKKALEIVPNRRDALDSLGRLYDSKKQSAEFQAYVRGLLDSTKPDVPYRYYYDMMKKADKKADATRTLEDLQAKKPKEEQLFMALATAYTDAGEKDKAIDQYKKLLAQNKEYPFANRPLGDLYKSMDKYSEAAACYAAASKRIMFDPSLYRDLGDMYIKLDKRAEALDAYRNAAKLDPANDEIKKTISALESGKPLDSIKNDPAPAPQPAGEKK